MRSGRFVVVFLTAVLLGGCATSGPFGPGWVTVSGDELEEAVDGATSDLPIGTCPWEPGAAPPIPEAPPADPVAATELVALPADLFWSLIESVPDRPQPDDFDALSSALAGCPLADVVAFEARLTLALYALDSPEAADWFVAHDPTGYGYLGDDGFQYQRCATVLAGRETWERAATEHTLDWGDDPFDEEGMSEYLLYVPFTAALTQGVSIDDFGDAVQAVVLVGSYTGSNTEYWGEAPATSEDG
jgi:hypothetical protein